MTDSVALVAPDEGSVAAGTGVVQSVLFPRDGFPDALYLRAGGPDGWKVDPATGTISATAGAELDFDAYFNAHYLAFWRRYTNVRRIGLSLGLTGKAILTVRHKTGPIGDRVLLRTEVDATVTAPLWIANPDGLPETGRLVFSLTLVTNCRIEAIDYVADAPRQTDIRLSIGLCTFNRETEVARLIDELATVRDGLPCIDAVHVVNQGRPFGDPRTGHAIRRAGARVVTQPNLGGAGGFCRTIVEARKGTATHHLLMDDDVLLDGRVIANALAILAYMPPGRVLGGSMLELDVPCRLYEAGAWVSDGWFLVPNGRGKGLDLPGALDLFDRVPRTDYNAWWFCIVPIEATGEAGLPLPIFLHGDDVEYGCRLSLRGFPTAVFPGVALWHANVDGKQRPWIFFYDLRNMLICSAVHPQAARPMSALDVLGWIFFRLVIHQYSSARSMMLAVEDFLTGPESITARPVGKRHDALTGLPPIDRLDARPRDHFAGTQPVSKDTFPTSLGAIVRLTLLRVLQISLIIGRRRAIPVIGLNVVSPATAGPGPYAVPDPADPDRVTVVRPHVLRFWGGTVQALWLIGRFLIGKRHAARAWRDAFTDLSGEDYWDAAFRAPPGGGSEGSAGQ